MCLYGTKCTACFVLLAFAQGTLKHSAFPSFSLYENTAESGKQVNLLREREAGEGAKRERERARPKKRKAVYGKE